jgi:hypothetical protein
METNHIRRESAKWPNLIQILWTLIWLTREELPEIYVRNDRDKTEGSYRIGCVPNEQDWIFGFPKTIFSRPWTYLFKESNESTYTA